MTGQWLGGTAGLVAGVLLAKTVLAAHPIFWGVGIGAAGTYYALRHMFDECNPLFGGATVSATICEQRGMIVGAAWGAAAGLIVGGIV